MELGYCPQIIFRAYDDNGKPLSGGLVETFYAGSSIPEPTYKDFSGAPWSTSFNLNASGEARILLDKSKAYKFIISNADGSNPQVYDNISITEGVLEVGGGTLNLQQVTDNGNTTTNGMEIGGQLKLGTQQINNAPTKVLGVDTLGNVVETDPSVFLSTTAGILDRIFFTGDTQVLTSGTYYKTSGASKGTVALVTQTVSPNDNQKLYFAQDLISEQVSGAPKNFPKGAYSGQLSVLGTSISAGQQQKFTIEVYAADSNGVPYNSGVSGAPIGDLGFQVISVLDSGNVTLANGEESLVLVSGFLTDDYSLAIGSRVRLHVSGEKIGIIGGAINLSVFYGQNANSYLDVPASITSNMVENLSTVTGANVTNALDWLNTNKEPTIVAGTSAQYWDGTKTWHDFASTTRSVTMGAGFTLTNSAITSIDSVLSAFGKTQGQINALSSSIPTNYITTNSAQTGLTGDKTTSGNWTFNSIIKSGGTSSQFLKADGSVDSNSYALASSLGNYIAKDGSTTTTATIPFAVGVSVTGTNADASAIRIPNGSWIRPQTVGDAIYILNGSNPSTSSGLWASGDSVHLHTTVLGSTNNAPYWYLSGSDWSRLTTYGQGWGMQERDATNPTYTRSYIQGYQDVVQAGTQSATGVPIGSWSINPNDFNYIHTGYHKWDGGIAGSIDKYQFGAGRINLQQAMSIGWGTMNSYISGKDNGGVYNEYLAYGTRGYHIWDNGILGSTAKYQFGGGDLAIANDIIIKNNSYIKPTTALDAIYISSGGNAFTRTLSLSNAQTSLYFDANNSITITSSGLNLTKTGAGASLNLNMNGGSGANALAMTDAGIRLNPRSGGNAQLQWGASNVPPTGTQAYLLAVDASGNIIQGSASGNFVTKSGHTQITMPWSIGDAATFNASNYGYYIDNAYGNYIKGQTIIEQATSSGLILYRPVTSGDICLEYDAWDLIGTRVAYAEVCGRVVSNAMGAQTGAIALEAYTAGVKSDIAVFQSSGIQFNYGLSGTSAAFSGPSLSIAKGVAYNASYDPIFTMGATNYDCVDSGNTHKFEVETYVESASLGSRYRINRWYRSGASSVGQNVYEILNDGSHSFKTPLTGTSASFSGQILGAGGTSGAPSYSFSSQPSLGFWLNGSVVTLQGALTTTGRAILPTVTATATGEPLNLGSGATTTSPSTLNAGAVFINATDGLNFVSTAGTKRIVADLGSTQTFSGAKTFSAAITANNTVTAMQLAQTRQTSATTTGAITWTLSSGGTMDLTATLTGAVTMNITAPAAGAWSVLFVTQGATPQTVTLSLTGVSWISTGPNGTTGTDTITIPAADFIANKSSCVQIYWSTTTRAYVTVT